jgi:hypothetical protein
MRLYQENIRSRLAANPDRLREIQVRLCANATCPLVLQELLIVYKDLSSIQEDLLKSDVNPCISVLQTSLDKQAESAALEMLINLFALA